MSRLTLLISLFVCALTAGALAEDPAADNRVKNSVVKVEASLRQPDLGRPWHRANAQEVTGSGLVIDGKRILTNAHVVAYASQVSVQGNNSSEKYSAKVEALATGIDLAVLKLDDEAFFSDKPPLPIASALPKDRDGVLVFGFPTGGTSVSVTKGIVSRVEFNYYDTETSGLRVQIDAAINPGNSGGPVVSDGKLMGVAFSRLNGSDNIGFVIPAEEVALFLDDVKDGSYDGKPAIYDAFQTLENPALRRKLKLPAGTTGIVVHRPEPPADGETPLKEWDLITRIGDHPVDNTGRTPVADGLNLPFQYFVSKLARDGKVSLGIVRDGQPMTVEVPTPKRRALVMPTLRGKTPSYFICGPMAFSNATSDLISGAELVQRGWFAWLVANHSPMTLRLSDRPKFPGEEIVVVPCQMFPHRMIKGYSDASFQTIRDINGVKIKSLRHLVETIRDSKDDLLVIAFNEPNSETIVLDRKEMIGATEEILVENSIRKFASDDLMAVWEKK